MSASGFWSSCGSSASTRAPNQASTVHQVKEPSSVIRLKRPNGMRAAPAGNDTRCRTTGRSRAKKMPAIEKWLIHCSASNHFFSGTKT